MNKLSDEEIEMYQAAVKGGMKNENFTKIDTEDLAMMLEEISGYRELKKEVQ